jgi:hypothetical protein
MATNSIVSCALQPFSVFYYRSTGIAIELNNWGSGVGEWMGGWVDEWMGGWVRERGIFAT